MNALQQLKSYDPTTLTSIEELVLMAATADALLSGYHMRAIEPPEWVSEKKAQLDREISDRTREANLKALRELEAAEDALKTASEKRAEIARKKARLVQSLGLTSVKQPTPQEGGDALATGVRKE